MQLNTKPLVGLFQESDWLHLKFNDTKKTVPSSEYEYNRFTSTDPC